MTGNLSQNDREMVSKLNRSLSNHFPDQPDLWVSHTGIWNRPSFGLNITWHRSGHNEECPPHLHIIMASYPILLITYLTKWVPHSTLKNQSDGLEDFEGKRVCKLTVGCL